MRFFLRGRSIGLLLCLIGLGMIISLILPVTAMIVIEGIILVCIGCYIIRCG